MTLPERIKWHMKAARDSAALAAKYAKSKDFREAADAYGSAAFHKAVAEALKIKPANQ